jgi:hypothetical protein
MISGITSLASLAYAPIASSRSSAPPSSGDQVSMSLSPETFASLVSDAGSMPEVRGGVVDAYKSQVQSGLYPTSDTVDGLVDLMGSTWAKAARG